MHWNRELRLTGMINCSRKNSEFFNIEAREKKSDVWYYNKVKRGIRTELNLNSIEVTIPRNDAIINREKFDKNANPSYVHASFKSQDIKESLLGNIRAEKIDKYNPIADELKSYYIKIRRKLELNTKYRISMIIASFLLSRI
jgi:hypothetical protein